MRDIFNRMGIMGELLMFMWKRKLYWLIPMLVILALFVIIIILQSNPITAPFIYSLI